MNRVLVTGLAIAAPQSGSYCPVCNYNFDWLITHPSTLLWADSIILTKHIKEVISRATYPFDNRPMARSIKLIFDVLSSHNVLEVKNPDNLITPLSPHIDKQAVKDRNLLLQYFPKNVKPGKGKRVPGEISIDKYNYCHTSIQSIYYALTLARAWGANCLFSPNSYNYCKFRFGLGASTPLISKTKVEAFNSVFKALLPEQNILPHYVVFQKSCPSCPRKRECENTYKDTYLDDVEKSLTQLLKIREYDEMYQMREVLSKIADKKILTDDTVTPQDIILEFQNTQARLSQRMHTLFPRVQTWTTVTTLLSTPIAVYGSASGNPLIYMAGAAMAGLSHVISKYVDILKSRCSWLGFRNDETTKRK